MNIQDEILKNPILRQVNEWLESPYLKEALELQTAKGIAKYPNTVNPDDYDVNGWINHSIQELIDSTIYNKAAIERLLKDEDYDFHKVAMLQFVIDSTIRNLNTLDKLRELILKEREGENGLPKNV